MKYRLRPVDAHLQAIPMQDWEDIEASSKQEAILIAVARMHVDMRGEMTLETAGEFCDPKYWEFDDGPDD